MPDYDLGTARGRIELDASSLGRASAALSGLGRSLGGFALLAGGALAYAVKSSADLEKTLSAVQAVTNATGGQMDELREKALTLATDSAFSAGEIAKAYEDLGKAGISVDDIIGGATEATIRLAEAAGDELPGGVAQGAEIIANALKTFNAGADQAMHFADVLVGAAASSTLSVDDMAVSMRYAGPIAASMGMSIDDLSTALAIMGDRGIKGSTAGTSLRGVLISLAAPSDKAAGVMEELGLMTEEGTNKFFDMNGALKPLPEVMWLLQNATKDLSEEEKAAAFNAIFQRRAMNAAMILAEQGAAGFYEYADAIAGLSAADIAATKLDNLSGDVTILKNTVDAFIKRVGFVFQDTMRSWVQAITDVVEWLTKLNPETLKMVGIGIAVAAALAGVLAALAFMASFALRAWAGFVLLREAFALVWGMAKLLIATLIRSPWGLVIAAIAGLIYVLYRAYQRGGEFTEIWDRWFAVFDRYSGFVLKFFRDFAQAVENLIGAFLDGKLSAEVFGDIMDSAFGDTGKYEAFFSNLYDGFVRVWDWVSENASKLAEWFIDGVGGIENALAIIAGIILALINPWLAVAGAIAWAYMNVKWFRDAINAIPGLLAAAWDGIKAFGSFLADIGRVIWDGLVSGFNWLKENLGPIFGAAGEVIVAFWNLIFPFFNIFWQLAQAAFNIFLTILQFVINTAITFWQLFGDNIIRFFQIAWNFVIGILEGVFQVILGILQVFAGIFTGDWGKIWEGVKNIVSGAWQIIYTILRTAFDLIILAFQTFVDILIFAWRVGWDLIKTIFSVAWQAIKALASAVWQAMQIAWDIFLKTLGSLAGQALQAFANLWNRVWTEVGNFLRTVLSGIVSFVVEKLGEMVRYWSQIPGLILGALASLGTMLAGVFTSALTAVINVVVFKGAEVIAQIHTLPGRAVAALGNVAGLLVNKGRELIQGFINGIKSMAGAVGDAVGGVLGGISRLVPGSPVKEGPLTVFNDGYVGKQLMSMLASGIMSGASNVQRAMGSLTSDMTAPLTGLTPAAPSTVDSSMRMTIENLTIQAQDLAEVNSVQQLFETLSDAALQGVNQHG